MAGPGDIPIIQAGERGSSSQAEQGLVWLVDGREVGFEENADARPWLEQSGDWVSGDGRAAPPADGGEELLWV